MAKDELPELLQFIHSHYNEKARWALDFKQVAHRRRTLLPGPHMPVVKRLTGKTEVPVLLDDGRVIGGSAAIIDHLESCHAGPSLYPAEPEQRAAALAVQRWLDEEIGGPARCAYFCDVLPDHDFMGGLFAWGKPRVAETLYRKSFGATHQLLKRVYALNEDNAEAGRARIREALDRIAGETEKTGYLVGSRFTVADLTAAGLLMFCAWPPEYHIPLPDPVPRGTERFLERWQSHPAVEWIRRMYAEHRGRSAEVAA